MSLTALVTGGGGFIGSRLVTALLSRGHSVVVLDVGGGRLAVRDHPNLRLVGLESEGRAGGMLDPRMVAGAMAGADVVFHLALDWNGGTWRRTQPLADIFDHNVRGTLNLLDAAVEHGVGQFLFASSEAVYGGTCGRVIDEEATCRPELWTRGDPGRAYGVLKVATERLCLLYHHEHGLPVTVLRIWPAFDEEDAQLLSSPVVEAIRRGEEVEVVEGRGRSSVHVEEIAEAFLMASQDHRAHGQVFNVLNPDTWISDQQLYELVATAAGSESRILTAPGALELGLERAEKIQRVLGWRPHRTRKDLDASVIATLRAWR